MNLSDRETVNQIIENPYLQYFLGFERFEDRKAPFDPSMLVHFRKRLSDEVLMEVNELIAKESASPKSKNDKDDDDTPTPSVGSGSKQTDTDENQGQLILDATCASGDIRYPKDVRLLNEAREKLERMIDVLHAPDASVKTKPRTYRNKARANYPALRNSGRSIRKPFEKYCANNWPMLAGTLNH